MRNHAAQPLVFGTAAPRAKRPAKRSGFTLVEVLVATTITLVLMAAVTSMFAFVTDNVAGSRAIQEMNGRLRHVKQRLQMDLMGITAPTLPPLSPSQENGYLEIIEGPIGPMYLPISTSTNPSSGGGWISSVGLNTSASYILPPSYDTTHGDPDDILMFTARAVDENFIGRWNNTSTFTSPLAEICWFMRKGILYRRVLLIKPSVSPLGNYNYALFDLSIRGQGGAFDREVVQPGIPSSVPNFNNPITYPNTLGDLTRRENRFGHQPYAWPYDARFWGRSTTASTATAGKPSMPTGNLIGTPGLGLPTMAETAQYSTTTTAANWPFPAYRGASPVPVFAAGNQFSAMNYANGQNPGQFLVAPTGSAGAFTANPLSQGHLSVYPTNYDPWSNTYTINGELAASYNGNRFDDVVLTNVLGFDVKVWDPGAPVFEITATSVTGTSNTPAALLPGDNGYKNALNYFSNTKQAAMVPGAALPIVALSSFGAYADLNYMWGNSGNNGFLTTYLNGLLKFEQNIAKVPPNTLPRPHFAGPGNPLSAAGFSGATAVPSTNPALALYPNPLAGVSSLTTAGKAQNMNTIAGSAACVYDTWSTHYESDGIDNDGDGSIDEGTDGLDNLAAAGNYAFNPVPNIPLAGPMKSINTKGMVQVYGIDDVTEQEAPPPYPFPLRGIQVRIRMFEPESKQVREVTVTHEFLQE